MEYGIIDLMICSLALDARFKIFAVQLCGLSRGKEYICGVAIRNTCFGKVRAAETIPVRGGRCSPSPPKRIKTGFFSSLSAFVYEGTPAPSSSLQHDPLRYDQRILEVAIETYRQMPLLSRDWILRPLLPLVASVSAWQQCQRQRPLVNGFSRLEGAGSYQSSTAFAGF
jgi:hypothetical protein